MHPDAGTICSLVSTPQVYLPCSTPKPARVYPDRLCRPRAPHLPARETPTPRWVIRVSFCRSSPLRRTLRPTSPRDLQYTPSYATFARLIGNDPRAVPSLAASSPCGAADVRTAGSASPSDGRFVRKRDPGEGYPGAKASVARRSTTLPRLIRARHGLPYRAPPQR